MADYSANSATWKRIRYEGYTEYQSRYDGYIQTSQSGNTTTVNWQLYRINNFNTSDVYFSDLGKVNIQITKGTLSGSLPGNYGDSTKIPGGTSQVGSGSFNIICDSNGDTQFTFYIDYIVSKLGSASVQAESTCSVVKNGTGVQTISMPRYISTTACGAPTSVSTTSAQVNNTFTVSWSGASSGSSNSISSYQVYYRIGSAPTTSTYTDTKNVTSTSTSGSTTFTLPASASVGATIYAGVVTRGSAGSSYYSGIKTGSGGTVTNTAPAAPSLNKSTQTIGPTSTGVIVTATAGSDPNTGQTISVRYNSSNSHSGESTGTSVTINPSAGSSATYYFWTYDGVAYSSATTITITKAAAPTAPSVTPSVTTVPSTGGSVQFTISGGGTGAGSYYYATSASGTKNAINSGSSLTANSSTKTFYFYSKDTYGNYSAATSKTITINTKPSLTVYAVGSGTTVTTCTYGGGTGASSYRTGWATAITPKIKSTKAGSLSITVEFSSTSSTSTFSATKTTAFTSVDVTANTDKTLSEYNMMQAAASQLGTTISSSTNYNWRLKFVVNDTVENSDAVYFPASGYFYSIPGASGLSSTYYNQFSTSNVTGSQSNHIYQRLRLILNNYDTSAPYPIVTATSNNTNLSLTATLSESGNSRYIDITFPTSSVKNGQGITLTVGMADKASGYTLLKQCSGIPTNIQFCPAPTLGALTSSFQTVKPFTQRPTSPTISLAWPFGTSTTVAAAAAAYDLAYTNNAITNFVLTHKRGTNSVNKTFTAAKSSDTLVLTYTSTLYNFDGELGITTYAGSADYTIGLTLTNVFGQVFTSPTITRYFNFNETPIITALSLQASTDNSHWFDWDSSYYMVENLYVRLKFSFQLYTKEDIVIRILRDSGNGSFTSVREITKSKDSSGYNYGTGYDTPGTNTDKTLKLSAKLGEISSGSSWRWLLSITGNATSTWPEANAISTNVKYLKAPAARINTLSVNNSKTLSYNITVTDRGYTQHNNNWDGSITYRFKDTGGNQTSSLSLDNTNLSPTGTVAATSMDWDDGIASIICSLTNTLTQSYGSYSITLTKTGNTDYVLVYMAQPTIAYRKNGIGINTSSVDSDNIVEIHGIDSRTNLFTTGMEGSTTRTATYNVNTQEIVTTGTAHSFKLYEVATKDIITYGTTDLTDGTSPLTTGHIYCLYD